MEHKRYIGSRGLGHRHHWRGEGHYSINHMEVKHSDIKLILTQDKILSAAKFRKGKITFCWDLRERLRKGLCSVQEVPG